MIVTRFAPSPTGLLHLGHAFAAMTAKQAGTRLLLRIEDIDAARCKPQFEAAIVEDMAWLGLDWKKPVLRQSQRLDAYRAALDLLRAQGLIYPCFCTRKEIAQEIARAAQAPHSMIFGQDGALYPGTCRKLSHDARKERMASGQAYALRLDARAAAERVGRLTFVEHGKTVQADPLLFGDIVLARKETPTAYHLAVVVDDAFQDVTLVTRGNDLLAATHVQRLLQELLGLPAPAYAHHRLVLDEHGKKFSKRDFSVTLRSLRENGVTPEKIREQLGFKF